MSLPLGLLLLALAILGTGYFAGMETAVISVDKVSLINKSRAGDRSARRLLASLERPEWLITTLLVGTNICIVGSSTVATAMLIELLPVRLHSLVALIVALGLTPLLFFIGELLPKIIGRVHADRLAKLMVTPLTVLGWLFAPVSFVAGGLSRLLFRLLKLESGSGWRISREELRVLMRRGEASGVVQAHRARIAGAAFTFADREVREVMTPLRLVRALPADTKISRAFSRAASGEDDHLLVYRERVDELVGAVLIGDLLRAPLGGTLQSVMREPLFVPESKSLEGMLDEFRRRGVSFAVVVDEFGSTLGVVTLNDVLGSLLGLAPPEATNTKPTAEPDAELVLPAETSLLELVERYAIELPAGDYSTLAGLFNDRLERIPVAGDELRLGDWQLRVVAARPRHAVTIALRRLHDQPDD